MCSSDLPYAHYTLGQIELARGNPRGAAARFAESMERARQNDDPYMVAYAERSLAEAYLAADNIERAEEHALSALALFRQLGIAGEVAIAERTVAEVRSHEGQLWAAG